MKSGASNWCVFFVLVTMSLSTPRDDQQLVSAQATHFGNETDRQALLEFKSSITNDPNGVLDSWNDSQHHCLWQGVKCGSQHGRVISLALAGNNLLGTLTPHIGNLSFMKFMGLGANRFSVEIPQQIGRLLRLRALNISMNSWTGEIPANLTKCVGLRNLSITGSSGITGKIPAELGSLSKLVILLLRMNNLIGKIPPSIGNLSSLQILNLGENQLEGDLPNEMGFLVRLSRFAVHGNKLTGEIPHSLYNISSLLVFSVAGNFFRGNPLNHVGLKLPNLAV